LDTLTHALAGASCGWLAGGARAKIAARERVLLGAAAGVFPDVDFAGFAVDPLRFLAYWHQGPTHSLLLLPLWAALAGALYCALVRRPGDFGAAAGIAALALAVHLLLDVLTAYGTALGWPWSQARLGLGILFVIDPVVTLLLAVGLTAGLRRGRRRPVVVACALLGAYAVALGSLQQRAEWLAERQLRDAGVVPERVAALAQPFSPFNWRLIALRGDDYHLAHVNLHGHPWWAGTGWVSALPGLGQWRALSRAYRAPAQLVWERRHRYGADPAQHELARQLWQRPDFAAFRDFAVFPAVSRIDRHATETCVWFTDLRYDLPALPDMFRYGYCQATPDGAWRRYRLRYFTDDQRQALDRSG
jgi:inner membrane protein